MVRGWQNRKSGILSHKLIFIILVALVVFLYIRSVIAPVKLAKEVIIEIPPKATTASIAQLLKDQGIIRNSTVFKIYVKQKGFDGKLRAGKYHFRGQVSLGQIKEKMSRGEQDGPGVTIPEGYNLEQMADLLAQKDLIDKKRFLEIARKGKFNYEYLPQAGAEERLEGFLFPDTYEIIKGWSEEQIIQIMLARFDAVFNPQWQKQAREIDMTILEVVTLASIIEKEAKTPGDRREISGVFHNRLKRDMRLESCATVQYALGEVKEVLLYKDLAVESPYNTYLYGGLPPGPIAAPGEDALYSALYPANSDYLFFVAKPDGTHHFSRTYDEHKEAKKKYLN